MKKKTIKNNQVGNTPMIYYDHLYYKLEFYNPSGSIKDRAAYNILKNYLALGIIKQGDTIIEATSGNMGIALAYFGQRFKIPVVIVMPDNVSTERMALIKKYGAKIILTDGALGMNGAIAEVKRLKEEYNYIPINQFNNEYNLLAHLQTGEEIIDEISDVDYIVCGIGSGGTISGIGKYLKMKNKKVKLIGVEPFESPIITKGKPGIHGIQGIGAGFVPPLINLEDIYSVEVVKTIDVINKLKNDNPLLLGLSGIATSIVGKRILEKEPNAKIVVIIADGFDRYESMIK